MFALRTISKTTLYLPLCSFSKCVGNQFLLKTFWEKLCWRFLIKWFWEFFTPSIKFIVFWFTFTVFGEEKNHFWDLKKDSPREPAHLYDNIRRSIFREFWVRLKKQLQFYYQLVDTEKKLYLQILLHELNLFLHLHLHKSITEYFITFFIGRIVL